MAFRLLFLVVLATGANILVWNPLVGQSHVQFLGNIADLLAEDGHNVTVVSAVKDETLKPFGCSHPSIRKILFTSKYHIKGLLSGMNVKSTKFWSQPISRRVFDPDMHELFRNSSRSLFEDQPFLQSLKDSKFDLGVTEMYHLMPIGLFELLDIKTSLIGAALGAVIHQTYLTGLPQFTTWRTTYTENMNFLERLDTFYLHLRTLYDFHEETKQQNVIFQQYFPGFPDLFQLMQKQVGKILSNVNEFTESPRPTSNMVQYVGGANVRRVKHLNEKMNNLMNGRKQTVLFSLGTFIQSCRIPAHLKKEILSAFDNFSNTTFIWKYEKCENDTTDFNHHPNVTPMEWVPQTDLLGDPRLSAFITHAGMNSMLELSFRGKPAITIPLFADQYVNAKNSVNRGLSITVDRTKLSRSTLSAALKEVLAPDSEIAKNARKAAEVLKGKDEEYRQAVKKWARLLIQFGKMEHLVLPTNNLNILQLYSIDCILFIMAIILFSLYAVVKVSCTVSSKLYIKPKLE